MPKAQLNKEDITPERLVQFKGFEHLTSEQAQMMCEFIIKYCSIVHQTYLQSKTVHRHEKCTTGVSTVC